ncbi:MAG TPA: hypothetical protein VGS28_02325 [Candidatus Saccharimonadales bacterium]|nr:hypothetical protein [Candidatus Saccharimonadales bacterium]
MTQDRHQNPEPTGDPDAPREYNQPGGVVARRLLGERPWRIRRLSRVGTSASELALRQDGDEAGPPSRDIGRVVTRLDEILTERYWSADRRRLRQAAGYIGRHQATLVAGLQADSASPDFGAALGVVQKLQGTHFNVGGSIREDDVRNPQVIAVHLAASDVLTAGLGGIDAALSKDSGDVGQKHAIMGGACGDDKPWRRIRVGRKQQGSNPYDT